MRHSLQFLSFLIVSAIFGTKLSAGDDASMFINDVRPLLVAKCVSCHGADKQEGNLRLDSSAAAVQGGDRGAAIVPRDPEKSLLVTAILFDDPDLQMPPKQKLSDHEIEILTNWVEAGAAWPETVAMLFEETSGDNIGDAFTDKRNPIRKIFRGERLDLWSLKTPQSSSDSIHQSIDEIVQPRLAEADRRTLIRRLTFDLTGLPPNSEDVDAFVADDSADAYDKRVDQLLNSTHYGTRQAQLWLDVVRYADTNGYERDEFRPLAWQYRDYVIRSFNQDKRFDQFIREQLAGDELVDGVPKTPEEADMLIATGYLRLGQWDSTAAIFQEEPRLRAEMMADLTNTTASAFLGLTMSCCQCHDHKYDPLSQADHYRFRAFFAGVTPQDDLVIEQATAVEQIHQHNAALDAQIETTKKQASSDDADATTQRISNLESQKRTPRHAMGATDSGSTAPATHVFYQGDFSSPREEVTPGFVSIFTPGSASIEPPRENTTGRRLALANWIVSPENPWTARVIVNRIWQQHFGTGIVATPNDFGFSGARPTHPELLDWLAVEFVNRGWSIKELHHMIVLSATYRQKSGAGFQPARSAAVDVQTHGRQDACPTVVPQSVRRLDAETLRDSLLTVSGLLKPYDTGKPIWPTVPEELLVAQPAILEAIEGKDDGRMQGWYADDIDQTDVRSLFLVRKRCLPIPFLQAFDLPDTAVSCARRDTTVVAPQALMLLNSPEGVRYARALADLLWTDDQLDFNDTQPTVMLINRLFHRTLSRSASTAEQTLAIDFLNRHRDHHAKTEASENAAQLAFTDLCRAVLNLNEFVYID